MIPPKENIKEKERLLALESFSILDTLEEADYDNLTAIAAEICGTPISLVSLLDNERQWFKSRHGLNVSETPKEYAFCAHAINAGEDVFIVQDSRTDERFHDNPLVIGDPHVIFYAGFPLITSEGMPLGTLCVIDHKPRLLSQSQIKTLKALSLQVMNLLNLRKTNEQLKNSITELEKKNEELDRFAYIAAHDLKSPLNNISSTAELFTECYADDLDEDGRTMLGFIKSASNQLRELIDGLLAYSKSNSILNEEGTVIDLSTLRDEINGLFSYDNSINLEIISDLSQITTNKTALDQILINLVGNAIKYNDKEHVEIQIRVSENEGRYSFCVKDNGPGIPEEEQTKIFQIFKVLAQKDKFGQTGNGIGLATVKKITEKMGGTINVTSKLGEGCEFEFMLNKIEVLPISVSLEKG